jgi:FkbM family methyltransferase
VYYRILKQKYVVLSTISGYNLKLRVNSTDLQAFTNVWLLEEYKKEGFQMSDNDIVIDVGAHIGLFTIYASQFCKTGKIFSFEPVKENFEILTENIKNNNISNAIIFNKAVLDKKQILKIYLNDDESAHSCYKEGPNFIEVESISLKEVMDSNNISICNFLKLDCEGAEYEILNALPDEYFSKIMKIVLEYHFYDKKPELLDKLKNRLNNLRYTIHDIPLSNGLGLLFIKK